MKTIYKQFARYILLRAALSLALGIIMFIFPAQLISAIIYLIAACFAVYGIIYFVGGLRGPARAGASAGLVLGVVLVVAAVLMLLFTRQIASVLPIFLGALLILAGTAQFVAEIKSREKGPADVTRIILCVLTIAGGVLGIINPFGTLTLLVRILGAFVAVAGLNELIFFIRAKMKAPAEEESPLSQ